MRQKVLALFHLREVRVLIAGAGTGGLTAALSLHPAGIEAVVRIASAP